MTRFFAGPLVLAFLVGLGSFNAPAWAQDNPNQNADAPAATDDEQETFLEKLEEDLKGTTTPTDVETDAIGTDEDVDRDLY